MCDRSCCARRSLTNEHTRHGCTMDVTFLPTRATFDRSLGPPRGTRRPASRALRSPRGLVRAVVGAQSEQFRAQTTVTRWSLTTPTDTLSVRWRSAPPLPTLAPRAKVSESQRPARFTRERHTIAAESSHVSHAPTPVSPPAHHRTRRLLAPASSSGSRGAGAYHQSLSAALAANACSHHRSPHGESA